jgi:hypothetical protein
MRHILDAGQSAVNGVDCVYMGSGNGKATRQTRLYADDVELIIRKARAETVRRKRNVPIAEIVHEQLAQLRIDERIQQRAGD